MGQRLSLEDYEITREGQVINKHSNRILKPQPNGKGYLRVILGGKRYFVHRLVAEKFIPNPENKEQVNHKDGNKLNNNADNLEWVTNKENRKHAIENNLHLQGEACPQTKLTETDVKFIREHLELNSVELGKLLNVAPSTIRSVRNYQSWKNS